jgi:hypothetical protein
LSRKKAKKAINHLIFISTVDKNQTIY